MTRVDYGEPVKRWTTTVCSLALLAIAVTPSTASADWRMGRAFKVAQARWGTAPCGTVHVRRQPMPSFKASAALAMADKDGCVIYLRPDHRFRGFGELCTVVLHEWGHITGYRDPSNHADPDHSSDPENLMSADYLAMTGWTHRGGRLVEMPDSGNWRCWDRGRTYLIRRGKIAPRSRHRMAYRVIP